MQGVTHMSVIVRDASTFHRNCKCLTRTIMVVCIVGMFLTITLVLHEIDFEVLSEDDRL